MPLKAAAFRRSRAAVWLLAAALALPALADEDPRRRLEAIQADLDRIERWLDGSRRDRDALQRELRRADMALAELATRVRGTERNLDTQNRRLDSLSEEIEALSAHEQAAWEVLQTAIRQAWLLSRRGPLQLLLEAESPERIARLLAYHEHLARARVAALEDLRTARAELEDRRTALAATRERLEQEHQRLSRHLQDLEQGRRDQARALARLETDIDAREASRAELVASQGRLQELIERLGREAMAPSGETFVSSRGRLPWPADGPVVQTFTTNPRNRGQRAGGVMLQAPAGSAVRAIHPGRVVFADWMRGLGLLIILDHGGGYMSLYAHAESLLRNPGDLVEAGEPLATAGQSGGSASSGIWFEIRHEGRPEDPGRWCHPPHRG